MQHKTTYKCIESEEEQETTEVEKSFQVSCFISQSESRTFMYIHTHMLTRNVCAYLVCMSGMYKYVGIKTCAATCVPTLVVLKIIMDIFIVP